ncbi:sigma-54-dependent Fis family transcriptional regulator, partial [Xanthomonas oryzae pv. oryzae]
ESGVGKELVARTIHEQGARAAGPFVPVNCGAIPAELMESEFFGHKKGSFTGAHADKPGLFQAAHGGTLFLDEVAELPLQMQVKLLRAIQEKSVRPVGASGETLVDVRILSATHKNLG